MKTAEEILSEYESFHYSTTELDETHYYKHNILEAMKEYARQACEAQREQDIDLSVGESRRAIATAPLIELK